MLRIGRDHTRLRHVGGKTPQPAEMPSTSGRTLSSCLSGSCSLSPCRGGAALGEFHRAEVERLLASWSASMTPHNGANTWSTAAHARDPGACRIPAHCGKRRPRISKCCSDKRFPLTLASAVGTLAASAVVTGAPAGAQPTLHHVRYTVGASQDIVGAEIYYRDTQPPNWADYSHNPYLYSPNVTTDLGPGKPWVLEAMLAEPRRVGHGRGRSSHRFDPGSGGPRASSANCGSTTWWSRPTRVPEGRSVHSATGRTPPTEVSPRSQ